MTTAVTSSTSVQFRHIFGINVNISDNISYLDEDIIVYVAGKKYIYIFIHYYLKYDCDMLRRLCDNIISNSITSIKIMIICSHLVSLTSNLLLLLS